ncbi:rho GTPase-activating protein conundrum [Sitodiplosis mosellana]|uniref:rho GTPase-activating protein conundrum n=1 Tax=Sitodiplosis mosellana TaxID=263140 RepID=UPI002444EC53|nr:rho GTPase-activating protein conundrum [Sitodiplosis mosellana]XP_055317788.1 rho GTPase-activating protein conundrum [Sitodiplosis mosellana]XP_055317789.1 rho GTPase-activating protein conundrum [Sitodiplosis mosellana]XP_055317791.1 rho GTPase-activating protein conundrum [Sitodiplosis mosellana]XP_055317792.1 rho GTPase-activating protein conundrum [Sitodiplosis mosellana]
MLDPDLDEYLTEYRLQAPAEPISHYEDGELEAEWLVAAGFPQLTKAFQEGRELPTNELKSSIAGLPRSHAEAVKQRVKALNRTVRGRARSRHSRKPDIRDVFRDVDTSSTGTRSRSATPDSLDSLPADTDHWNSHQIPSFVSIFDNPTAAITNARIKQNLRRTPSEPLRVSADLFRGSHIRCDIPFYTADGIELLGFQRLGTIHLPRIRSGSDPSCSLGRRSTHMTNARSHNNLYNSNSPDNTSSSSQPSTPEHSPSNSPLRHSLLSSNATSTPCHHHMHNSSPEPVRSIRNHSEPVSFENLCRDNGIDQTDWCEPEYNEGGCDIDQLNETELKKLQPLLWLELATIFDRHNVAFDKRKPFKRKRKEEGNVFGVSLNALIRRDQQVTGEDSTLVPLLLQGILDNLRARGTKEEGILRVAGNKQKTEMLYNELEQNFYSKHDKVSGILKKAGVHDLSALLKRWLRELPTPLLANDLVHLFYQTADIPVPDQFKVMSILCLLLPHENRNTLRAFLEFLRCVIDNQQYNKMSKHNVATIIAPSLFSPRYIHPADKNDIAAQVRMAAQCCKLADIMISRSEQLWTVPQRLIDQARQMNTKNGMGKRQTRKVKNSISPIIGNSSGAGNHNARINANHVHKIAI